MPLRLPARNPRRAFTILEVLVVIGVLLVLMGLTLPMLKRTKQTALGTRCAAEIRQWTTVFFAYAQENRDSIVYPLDSSLRATRGNMKLTADLPWLPPSFSSVAGLWPLAVAPPEGDPFADPVLCPEDTGIRRDRDRVAGQRGQAVFDIYPLADRNISMAFYLAPSALDPARPRWERSLFVPMKLSGVSFPARKALLFDKLPFHSARFVHDSSLEANVYALVVGAVDGSVQSRRNDQTTPGIVFAPDSRPGFIEIERRGASLLFTPRGILGTDW